MWANTKPRRQKNVVTNPSVLIEVLSPSTEDYNRGAKFKLYRDIPSLQEYIMLSSTEILIEKFTKQADSKWLLELYKNANDVLEITTIGLRIGIAELYANVIFETTP